MSLTLDPTANDPREAAHIFVEKFWIKYVPDDKDAGKLNPVEMVLWGKKGQHIMTGQKTPMRVTQAKKDKMIWATIQPYYDAWKAGQEMPADGTPLAAWPGVTSEMVDRLKLMRVRTVEDVAAMTDNDIDNLGMGGLAVRQQARLFIDHKKDKTAIATEVAVQIGGMQAEIEKLRAALAAKSNDAPETATVAPKKRGRRSRAEIEAEAAAGEKAA